MTYNPTREPMNSLPLYIYTAYKTHQPLARRAAFGAASVLLAMVLLLFVVARCRLAPARRGRRRCSEPVVATVGQGDGTVRRRDDRRCAGRRWPCVISLVGPAVPAGVAHAPDQRVGLELGGQRHQPVGHGRLHRGRPVVYNPDGDAQGRQDFANRRRTSPSPRRVPGRRCGRPGSRTPPTAGLRLPAGGRRGHLVPLPDPVRRPRSRTSDSRGRRWPRSSPTRSPTGTTPRSPRTTTVCSCPPSPSPRWSSPRARAQPSS